MGEVCCKQQSTETEHKVEIDFTLGTHWSCHVCEEINKASRNLCNNCGTSRLIAAASHWVCIACGETNKAVRPQCNNCGCTRREWAAAVDSQVQPEPPLPPPGSHLMSSEISAVPTTSSLPSEVRPLIPPGTSMRHAYPAWSSSSPAAEDGLPRPASVAARAPKPGDPVESNSPISPGAQASKPAFSNSPAPAPVNTTGVGSNPIVERPLQPEGPKPPPPPKDTVGSDASREKGAVGGAAASSSASGPSQLPTDTYSAPGDSENNDIRSAPAGCKASWKDAPLAVEPQEAPHLPQCTIAYGPGTYSISDKSQDL